MEKGVRRALPNARVLKIPLADGGEGTLDALCPRQRTFRKSVRGPLGKPVSARWGFMRGKPVAVVEMAQASGLPLVPKAQRNPMKTASFGTGELIKEALNRGAKKIILTLGGVATNDGGMGMARALGYRFLDKNGKEVPEGAQGFKFLQRIDSSILHPKLRKARFEAACDVKNPLCGPNGSARVFGPQKGATPAMVKEIDRGLRRFAGIIQRDLGKNVLHCPGAGAAGGAGAGALAFLNARLLPGIDIVLSETDFDKRAAKADLILSGEGKIDRQTLFGKTISGVARAAQKRGAPLLVFCGQAEEGFEPILRKGVTKVLPLVRPGTSVRQALRRAGPLLAERVRQALANDIIL